MTNKPVTMSRELIDGVPRELLERLQSQTELSSDWDEVQALLAAPVVERQPVAYFDLKELARLMDIKSGYMSIIAYRDPGALVSPLYAEQPAPVAVVQHPFADKVIRKLQRFQECTDDNQGADIGRHWFDLLTQLGLLNRVQRSPALWEITQQGEDCLDKELNQ